MKKSILRIVSMVLSIALLAGCINVGVFATGNNGMLTLLGSVSGITDAKIIADYAGNFLSDGEKAVLHCTALVGNEHNVTAPTDDDRADLIIINKEDKIVEVKNFTDDEGYVWKPAKVQLVYGNTSSDITLDANGKGSFECDSNTYSIEVTYVASVKIESGLFQTLVNAPMYLSNGIINMNAVAALAGDMEIVAANVDTLYNLLSNNLIASNLTSEVKNAITDLYNDRNEASNGSEGKKFGINNYIEVYNTKEDKVTYLLENGDDFKIAFERVYNNLYSVVNDKLLPGLATMGGAGAAFTILEGVCNDMGAINPDNWAFIKHTLVKSTATTAELSALNDAVLALAQGGEITRDTMLEELSEYPAASKTLKQGVDQFNVTVKVQANVIKGKDSNALTPETSDKTVVVTLDKGATKAEVIAAIKATGVITNAINAWAADEATKGYEINETNYTVTDDNFTGLDDTLTKDVICTVVFEPVKYSLDFCGTVTEVPYGYVKTLTTYAIENNDGSKSYDYTVNGSAMREGLTYRVVGDTVITRTEGKATASYLIREVVANSYKPGTDLSADARSILYSTAIKSESIYYRTPANLELVEVKTVAEGNYKVTAELLYSGLPSGAYWMPVGGYLINGSTKVDDVSLNFYDTETNRVADVTTNKTFTEVKVEYQLVIAYSDVDGLTDTYVNLPHTLVEEATAQKSILGSLSGSVYKNLSSIDGQMASILFTLIANDTQYGLSQATKDAAKAIQESCLDANNHFYILDHITGYKTNGLAYLYTGDNSEKIKAELEVLRTHMLVIVEDENLDDFITGNISLMPDANANEYIDKLDGVGDVLKDLDLNDLNVNYWIKTDAGLAVLKELAAAIEAATGDTKNFGKDNELILSETLSAPASDSMKKLVVNVSAYNSAGSLIGGKVYTGNLTFTVEQNFSQDDVNKINALVSELEGNLGIDKDLYVSNEFKLPAVDDEFTGTTTINITYTPKSYTVNVAGEDQTIYSDNTTVILPACTVSGAKYVYKVPGRADIIVTNEAAQITFSADELKTLFANDTLNITRETVVLSREDVLAFAEAMNNAFKSAGVAISFSALENAEGNIVLVLNVDASVATAGQGALMAAVQNMSTALANSSYVGLGGYEFWNADTLSISIQALIDMIADSDLGLAKITGAIGANGNIIPVKLNGYNVVAGGNTVGAELIKSTLAHNEATNVYDLYITLSGDAATLNQLDTALTSVRSYADFQCGNGKYNVSINVPKAVYAIYLTQMLITERADLTNVTAMNTTDNLKYEISLIKELFANPEFNADVIEATAAKLGYALDLSEYSGVIEMARKAVNYLLNLELESEGTYYEGSISFLIRDKLVALGLDAKLLDFVKEASADSEGLKVNFSVEVDGLDEKYEALVVDYNAAGYLNKYYVTDNLDDVLGNLGNNAVVILLSDVVLDKAVTINNNAFINLNGFTLTGDMTAKGTVRIVDSLISTACGEINGSLSGNFVITGGKYYSNISDMLPDGYGVSADGYVYNKLYSVSEKDGNIIISLLPGMLDGSGIPDINAYLVDVAFDIALNMFTKAQMTVNGNEIYNIELNDIMSYLNSTQTDLANTALDFINWSGLTNFINTVVADVYDFDNLAKAIESDKPVVEYKYSAKAWGISPLRVENGYITLDVTSGIETSGTISVVLAFTEEQKAALVELCESLGETVSVNNLYLNVTDITYNGGYSFDLEYDASADIEVNFSSNHNYAALIGTAVAYAMPEGTAKTNLVKALAIYFDNGNITELAKALDNVTAAQLIAAIKALSSTTCEAMLTKLGLTSADVVALEAVYGNLIDIAGAVLARLDITGPASKLSAIKVAGTDYEYAFVRENVRGYNVDIAFKLVLFSETDDADDIVIEEPVIDLDVSSDIVAGWEVANDMIFVDITPAGWSVDDVTHIVFKTTGADKVVVAVLDKNGNEKTNGLICNGDKVKVVASNAKGSVEAEYTVIIMGDTNADGVTNIGDAYAIAQYYTGVKTLDAAGLLAADLNGDGAINVGDTYKIAIKYTSWDDNSYNSDLENK